MFKNYSALWHDGVANIDREGRMNGDSWKNISVTISDRNQVYGVEQVFVEFDDPLTQTNLTVFYEDQDKVLQQMSFDYGKGSPHRLHQLSRFLENFKENGQVAWDPGVVPNKKWYNDFNVVGIIFAVLCGVMLLIVIIFIAYKYSMDKKSKTMPQAQILESALSLYEDDDD